MNEQKKKRKEKKRDNAERRRRRPLCLTFPLMVTLSGSGKTFPPEIITDILSRLPVKSLCRFKCVSPSWNSLISSPFFARTHFNRTKTSNPKQFAHNIIFMSTTNLYSCNLTADVLTATKLHLPSLQSLENQPVYAVGSCHGLLLFCNAWRSKFFLSNPSTRECKELPHVPFVSDPGHKFYKCLHGVGYDSSTDDYKVVMLFDFPKPSSESETRSSNLRVTTTVVVYSAKANAWRRIQDTQRILVGTAFGVYFNGCLHWVHCTGGSYAILAFDLADEILKELPLPAPFASFASLVDDEIYNYKMVVVGDSLCLVYTLSDSQIEVWEMKESGDRVSWSKSMIEIMTDVNDMSLLGLLAENEFVLITEVKRVGVPVDKLVVYNPQTGMLRDIVVGGIPNEIRFWGTYVESLLPCLY